MHYLPASDSSLPALALQILRMVDSYMLWIGTTDVSAEDVSRAPLQGNLARDWACAMPPSAVCSLIPVDSESWSMINISVNLGRSTSASNITFPVFKF